MRIGIIIPPKVNDEWIAREDKHAASHGSLPFAPYTAPQMLAIIKKYMPKDEVVVIEAQRDGLNEKQTIQKIRNSELNICLVYMSCFHIPWDRKYAELDVPAIGIILQQTVPRNEAIDIYDLKIPYLVKMELEMPIIEALKEFKKNDTIKKTKGFLIRTKKGYVDTGNAELADLSKFPIPDFEGFDYEKYFELLKTAWKKYKQNLSNDFIEKNYKFANLNSMKGCRFNCSFCGQASKNMGYRYKTAKQVFDEVKYLYERLGVKSFVFFDNEFGVNLERAKDFCRLIIKNKLKIRFEISNRAELFDDELIELLKKAGCEKISIGVESGSARIRKVLNKTYDPVCLEKIVFKIKQVGIKVKFYMMVGIEGEGKKDLMDSVKLLVRTQPDELAFAPLFLMPGSTLYNKCMDKGRIHVKDWKNIREKVMTSNNKTYKSFSENMGGEYYILRKYYFNKFIETLNIKYLLVSLYSSSYSRKFARIFPVIKKLKIFVMN